MPVHVCSLILQERQSVEPGDYRIVLFPFGSAESDDFHGMHQVEQPQGAPVADWRRDERAGLIWPTVTGWATLVANLHWEPGGYDELRDQFVRDPLGFTSSPVDTTATDHRPPSPGMQCFTKQHAIWVHPGVPVALRVAHTDSRPRALVHAQFKLAIHT